MKTRTNEYSNQFPTRPLQAQHRAVKPRIGTLWYKDTPTSEERVIENMVDKPFPVLAKERNRLSAFGYVLKRFVIHYK